MERLTRIDQKGWYIEDQSAAFDGRRRGKEVDLLAAYEDTQLGPKQAQLISNVLREVGETYNCWFDYVVNCVLKNSHLKELAKAEKDGRLVVLPCKVGDTVLVDVRTLPYNYLHPNDKCGDYAKCEIVSIITTKEGTYIKLRALYPSRAGRRGYLRYGVTAIGKTVFLTREEAEVALKKREVDNEVD